MTYLFDLYKGENFQSAELIGTGMTETEINQYIVKAEDEPKYCRYWVEGSVKYIDYGSWSTYYFVVPEGMYR